MVVVCGGGSNAAGGNRSVAIIFAEDTKSVWFSACTMRLVLFWHF